MDWQYPQALYLILPICLGWLGLSLYSQHRRRLAFSKFVAEPMWSKMLPTMSSSRFWMKMALRQCAIIASLVAIAGPRYGDQFEQIIPRGSDLYVLIDVSRSMLATDVAPSRLGRAKADVASLLNRLEGERVGLIAFAGQSVVKCPLTVDYDSFRRALNELDTNSAPRGGTAIGDAIRKSLEVFQANADRDQSILLITDGDDQQSYPLEAAAAAAERKVTIFTLGLGDSATGSRIPQKGSSGAFVEHAGEQVWSKLDNSLLQEIAIKTSGVHIPAGTRSYDLGELYTQNLQGRRGNEAKAQQRITRSERFQAFLAVALFALLIDYCISPYAKLAAPADGLRTSTGRRLNSPKLAALSGLTLLCSFTLSDSTHADDSAKQVRDGIESFSKKNFKKAIESFSAATQNLEKSKSDRVSIALFDEGCAFHRDGDTEKARDRYLQAGLSKDRVVAVAAHFNLATLESDKAKELAGEKPEEVPTDKRQEIIDHLLKAIAAHRHCLELNPSHVNSRKNIELIRQWIKFYTDKWHAIDRQKRRDETNVFQFLEFILKTQSDIQSSVNTLTPESNLDLFAEWKRVQDELNEEMPFLREKIDSELRPPKEDSKLPNNSSASTPTEENNTEIEQAISLLQSWSDDARSHMETASEHLSKSASSNASSEQTKALETMDRIWDAIAPFHPLLNKDISLQKKVVDHFPNPPVQSSSTDEQSELNTDPQTNSTTNPVESEATEPTSQSTDSTPSKVDPDTTDSDSPPATNIDLVVADLDWNTLRTEQEAALKKAVLLRPKAESELAQFLQQQQQQQQPENAEQQIDPEAVKAGYDKAIELAPSAVSEMESAISAISAKDPTRTARHAIEAKRILDEIQKAQPKSKNEQDQQQDQEKQDQKENEEKSPNEEKNEEKKDNSEEKNQDKKDQQQDKDKDDQSSNNEKKQDDKKPSPQVTQDRIEEALRKVREREQQKRERDKELRARILGRTPVDKDW